MADVIDRNRELDQRYRDQGDGTYAPPEAALEYVWDPVNLVWVRNTGDGTTGAANVNVRNTLTVQSAAFTLSSTGTVVAAVPTMRIKVFAIILDASSALSCNWRDGASTALEGSMAFAANGGYTRTVNPPHFIYGTTAGNSLDLVVSGGGTASGSVSYWATDTT